MNPILKAIITYILFIPALILWLILAWLTMLITFLAAPLYISNIIEYDPIFYKYLDYVIELMDKWRNL